MKNLGCEGNRLTALNLSANPAIKKLTCNDNQLTSLEYTAGNLDKINCENNPIKRVDCKISDGQITLTADGNGSVYLDYDSDCGFAMAVENGSTTFLNWQEGASNISTNKSVLIMEGTVRNLTARFDKYAVTFDKNGGDTEAAPANKIVSKYAKITPPETLPTKEGYDITGWYREPECSNEWNFYSDKVSKNITLYPK